MKSVKNKIGHKHGFYYTKFYRIWSSIVQRCTNPNNKNFGDYGGRGIIVCDGWNKFLNFKKDMLLKYTLTKLKYPNELITIERVDNNKGYFKNNCTFIPLKYQCNNKRNVISIKATNIKTKEIVIGKSQCDLARKLGITHMPISRYLHGIVKNPYSGWIFEKINKGEMNHAH
jgi:hypothetical protein